MKAANPAWLSRCAAQVWLETVGHGRFAATLDGRAVLVPVPGSAATQDTAWVGERLAWCLREVGLAAEVWPLLRRLRAVRKSAFAAAGSRPTVLEHFASFAVERAWAERGAAAGHCGWIAGSGGTGLRLILVDDVVTRGRTLLAAAGRLRDAFPAAEIRAFALVRTLGRHELLCRVLDPCEGEIRWMSGDARRSP